MGDNNNAMVELDELDNNGEPLHTPPSLPAPLVQHPEPQEQDEAAENNEVEEVTLHPQGNGNHAMRKAGSTALSQRGQLYVQHLKLY
jgi:hypothetical protein